MSVQISVLFKKTKFTVLKSVYLDFKTSTKQVCNIFSKKTGKNINLTKIFSNALPQL